MPKATVTIDLPEGWELSEPEMRPGKRDEWGWWPGTREPVQFSFNSTCSWLIVRRIADQYVNVRLRREDAEFVAIAWKDSTAYNAIYRLGLACREALRERCGVGIAQWDSKLHAWGHTAQCTLPAGHAGPHGV